MIQESDSLTAYRPLKVEIPPNLMVWHSFIIRFSGMFAVEGWLMNLAPDESSLNKKDFLMIQLIIHFWILHRISESNRT